LGPFLLDIEKPARYVGGEYGIRSKKDAPFQAVIGFPDLYEIGMSNQALRILYNGLNDIPGISCERVFAPAPDFEKLLREKGIPLYGLDTGLDLRSVDLFLFTLGYELGITGVLTILDLASIPIHACNRGGDSPLVIMGGPCVSNPLPYSAFIDAFWIGEAEGGFFEAAETMRDLKKQGASRSEILSYLISLSGVWAPGKEGANRVIYNNFGKQEKKAPVFPVPSIKVVQHHGSVEIMRGCPNGCRFCHAGYWYRPMRQKSAGQVQKEAADFINEGGYREISLSSLSTGDYCHIDGLVNALNDAFARFHVSFQLPSLRVSTFSLPLLEKVSKVRKSGLTFAVETPDEFSQLALNKQVFKKDILQILLEAKKHGWRGAKFYFMIGLPHSNSAEEEVIINFIRELARESGIHFNVNVGTFIPKPHTPYQRAAQMDEDTALNKLNAIRENLKKQGHKVGIQDPFISVLEGILSRGDERVGELIEEAWNRGCRLDAWNEFLKKEIWRDVLGKKTELVNQIFSPIDPLSKLPWDMIDSGLHKKYYTEECNKSKRGEITLPCDIKCNRMCGVCGARTNNGIVKNNGASSLPEEKALSLNAAAVLKSRESADNREQAGPAYLPSHKILFLFSKTGPGLFYSQLTLLELFSMAFVRGQIPVKFSGGFNPLPVMEIPSPLAIGISAGKEIAAVETEGFYDKDIFIKKINRSLPNGIAVSGALNITIPFGNKKYSLSSILWGAKYKNSDGNPIDIPFREEKKFRETVSQKSGGNIYGIHRLEVLAADPSSGENPPIPYFDAFKMLYA
jgi:radical SAM family uncharacterized protein